MNLAAASRALLAGNFAIGCGVMVVAGSLNDLVASLQVSVALGGQLITVAAVAMALGAPLMAVWWGNADRRLLLTLALLWLFPWPLLASAEPLLVATIRIGAAEGLSGGECQLGMPLVDLETALSRMTKPVKFAATRRVQTPDQRKHLDAVVGAARLPMVFTLGTTTLTIGEVLALALGDVLVLDQRQGQPAIGRVAGATRVLGRIGRVGPKLAVAVEKTLPVPPAKKDQP